MGKRAVSLIALLLLVLLVWTPALARSRLARPAVRVVFPLPVVVYPVAATIPVVVLPSCPAGHYWSRRWQRCLPRCAPGQGWYRECKRCLPIR